MTHNIQTDADVKVRENDTEDFKIEDLEIAEVREQANAMSCD